MKRLCFFMFGRFAPQKSRKSTHFRPSLQLTPLEDRAVPAIAAPYIIPLELVNIKTPQNPEYKLGIYVGLGGGAPKLYEFDTGGKGFWAAYLPNHSDNQWWGPTSVKEQGTLNNTYSSGNTYQADLVSTTVTFYAAGNDGQAPTPVVTTGQVDLARISQYKDQKHKSKSKQWEKDLENGKPPLLKKFYGDFGASLQPISSSTGTNIFSILPQIPMPEGLDVGFTVHVGEIVNGKAQPYLQIGIDPNAGSSAAAEIAMITYQNPANGAAVNFPITNVSAYAAQVVNANFELHDTKTGLKQTFSNLGWTIDTGAPASTIYQTKTPKNKAGIAVRPGFFKHKSTKIRDGVDLKITADSAISGQPGFETTAKTGKPLPKIPLEAKRHITSSASSKSYINTGLWTFSNFDVSFNLSKGRLGLGPASSANVR